jgi:penicillin G amidase
MTHPLLRWIATGLALILCIAGIALLMYRFQSLPKTTGEIKVGIGAQASIARDSDGVPTITAASLNDAWFAMGFAHAQDRLWQLEMQKRIAAGRLSEVLGKATLDTDKFLRTLGVRRTAALQLQKLDEPTQQALQHYAKGVNAGIEQTTGKGILPPEFIVLGVKPEPWEPVDSVAWWLMMSWDLGGNWPKS